jgi:putative transposase
MVQRSRALRDDLLITMDCPAVHEVPNWSEWLKMEDSKANEIVRRHTRTGRPLGREEFLRRLENQTGRKLISQKRGRPARQEAAVIIDPEKEWRGTRSLFG